MQTPAREVFSRREFYIFLYKYRRRLLLAFLLPFLAALVISFIPTPRYKAESVLIVRLGSEFVYQPEVGNAQNGDDLTIPFQRDQIFKSEVAILSSADLHRQVIHTIGLDMLFPEIRHPEGFAWLMAGLREGIDGIGITLGFAERLTDEQLERRQLATALDMFERRFDILLEKESAVIDVSFEHKDSDIAVKALQSLLSLYYDKRKQVFLEPRVELAQAQLQSARNHAQTAQMAVEDYKRKHKLYSLDEERRQLLDLRKEALQQSFSISDRHLKKRIESYGQKLDELDAEEREFQLLQRESDIANESYRLYSHRLDEARAYEELQRERVGSVRVIQPPITPPEPRKLQWLIILAGAILSAFIMLLAAAITEAGRSGFLVPEQLERSIGVPVLATIPYSTRA